MEQVTANTPLKKPTNFEEARETESKCVKFAKEVKEIKSRLYIYTLYRVYPKKFTRVFQ